MRRGIWEFLLVLLGVVLPYYISNSIPSATVQRDAGAAVIGLVVCILLVVAWEAKERTHFQLRLPIVLRSPIVRKKTTTESKVPPPIRYLAPIPAATPKAEEKTPRVYTTATQPELVTLGRMPGLTGAERTQLLKPHIGKLLTVEGIVEDANVYKTFVQVQIRHDDPASPVTFAHFNSDLDRVAALRKGARIRLEGKITGASNLNGSVALDDCELL
jgi:tRNA_anti-like